MVEVSQLTKFYGKFSALENVSFEVRTGETFAVLGPNGSGKTSILKCIAGLIFPSSGFVRVRGIDVCDPGGKSRALLSYLPQRAAFNESLTARELVRFHARLRDLPPARVEQALAASGLGLNGFCDQPVGTYSGGMIQRLAIMLVLLPDAPLLILDEPAASLDPEGAILFREVLRSLKRTGKTILFSSHGLADVELLADRVAVLVGGRLVALEPVSRLERDVTVRLRIVLKNPDPRYGAAALTAGASDAVLANETLTVCCAPEVHQPVLHAIQQAGGVVERISTDRGTLEELYLRYVKNVSDPGMDPDGRLRPGSTSAG